MVLGLECKKEFLNYVLNNCDLKRKEYNWFLHYLKNHEMYLENVIFSTNVNYSKNYIVITGNGIEGIPFVYKNGNYMTSNVDEAINHIRFAKKEKIYLEFSFEDEESNLKFLSIIEDNPYFNKNVILTPKERLELDFKINNFNSDSFKKYLLEKIDESLDCNDRDRFLYFSNKLKDI